MIDQREQEIRDKSREVHHLGPKPGTCTFCDEAANRCDHLDLFSILDRERERADFLQSEFWRESGQKAELLEALQHVETAIEGKHPLDEDLVMETLNAVVNAKERA